MTAPRKIVVSQSESQRRAAQPTERPTDWTQVALWLTGIGIGVAAMLGVLSDLVR